MGVKLHALGCAIKTIGWKIRYGKRLEIEFPQAMYKAHISISKNAKMILKKRLQNYNGGLYLSCRGNGVMTIGEHTMFNANVCITCVKKITIGDNCRFANNFVMIDHDHNINDVTGSLAKGDSPEGYEEFPGEEIVIGNGVWVGANCTILKGVHIGDNAIGAAGSTVRKDIPADTIYYEKGEAVYRPIIKREDFSV